MPIVIPQQQPLPEEPDRIGSSVGVYKLLELLGEGAMGRVYLAEHQVIHRKVALKMLRREHASDPMAVQRFFTEARAVNRINHENIVQITDFIENPGGDNAFIMELLRGDSLKALLAREAPLPLERGVAIMLQVAGALQAVHQAGIIHRDLKPENVFLTDGTSRKDFVKLLDFGVAKSLDLADKEALQRTNAGSILGTPEYMSPEQVAAKPVDQRSDIYSFGIVMYEIFTGKKPFEAKSFGELVIKHLTQPATRPSKLKLQRPLPKTLEDTIMKCLAKTPSDRPQDVREVVAILDELSQALAQGQRLVMAKPHSRTAAVIAATGALGLFGGLIAAAISTRSIDGQSVAVASMPPLAPASQPAVIAPPPPETASKEPPSAPSAPPPAPETKTPQRGRGATKLKTTMVPPSPAAAQSAPASGKTADKPKKSIKDTNAVLDPFAE